ncbi:MAG TPA: DUF6338 family protein [Candidatus Tumulicola sp.]|nr:DUF6338 family protein [Candidatus Tumulicola sp.]
MPSGIWNTVSIVIFLAFFVPGFVSMQVFSLLVPTEPRDFSKQLPEAIGFSALNYAVVGPVLFFMSKDPVWFVPALYISLLLLPIGWPFLYLKVREWLPFTTVDPYAKPWDYVLRLNTRWVILHLRNGEKLAGKYGFKSFASSYPAPEQIYLEEVWTLDEHGSFSEPHDRTRGIIVNGADILMFELLE